MLDSYVTETYQTIAPTHDVISVKYSHESPVSSQHLLHELELAYDRDRVLGVTTVGPHRHDLLVSFNGEPADEVGSRGELRTITLALKFIEAAILIEQTGLHPIILLDDVFSELDRDRQTRLMSEFHNHQVIMTSTNDEGISKRHIVEIVN